MGAKMLSTDKHCELLDTNIRDKIATIYASFRLFIQLFSAIIGGSIALYLQGDGKIPPSFALLANALAALVVITCGVMIVDAQFSWRRFRLKLSEVAPEIPPPLSLIRSSRTVGAMLLVMILALALFVRFNPLQGTN